MISTMCGQTQQGWSHSGTPSGRALGGDVCIFQKQGDFVQKYMYNFTVCHVYAWHKCSC